MSTQRGRITVVGLGPGPDDRITAQARAEIDRIPHRYLRTTRHPSGHLVTNATSFDDEYERHAGFDDVYRAIARRLADAAVEHGEVLYAVPGSPLVLETTVTLLRADPSVDVVVIPAVSFLDEAWAALGIDPVTSGVRLVDAHRFAEQAANEHGPLLVAQCHAQWVMSDIKLANDNATGDEEVVVLHHLGLPDERIVATTWAEIDRLGSEPHRLDVDHLTSLWIPRLGAPIGGEMVRLHALARTLREKCPWDAEQTHRSLVRYLIEETYEVVDALHALDPDDPASDEPLIEELGDLLYQIEFHTTIAEQQGRFTLAEVAQRVHDKLIRRHPHVFADVEATTADDVVSTWDEVKRGERAAKGTRASFFDGVARSAPSLALAQKIQKRAAEVGFDWPDSDGALAKLDEETHELRAAIGSGDPQTVALEVGDVLFSVVNVVRKLGLDAEATLRTATDKFIARFEGVVRIAGERGIALESASLAQLDSLWDEVKAQTTLGS